MRAHLYFFTCFVHDDLSGTHEYNSACVCVQYIKQHIQNVVRWTVPTAMQLRVISKFFFFFSGYACFFGSFRLLLRRSDLSNDRRSSPRNAVYYNAPPQHVDLVFLTVPFVYVLLVYMCIAPPTVADAFLSFCFVLFFRFRFVPGRYGRRNRFVAVVPWPNGRKIVQHFLIIKRPIMYDLATLCSYIGYRAFYTSPQ